MTSPGANPTTAPNAAPSATSRSTVAACQWRASSLPLTSTMVSNSSATAIGDGRAEVSGDPIKLPGVQQAPLAEKIETLDAGGESAERRPKFMRISAGA